MSNIGLQLYSIKELCKEDFFGTLEKVAHIGYDGVEFAGFYDAPAPEVRKVLDGSDLKACGSHTGIGILKEKFEETVEYNREIGSKYIICPGIPEEMRNSADAWKRTAELFNGYGLKCKEYGMSFGYHNHAAEFEMFDGVRGYDILAENTQADLVQLEIDTYWVEHAGLSSTDLMKKYPDRLSLLHVKDMSGSENKENTEIGKGVMNFKAITQLGRKLGTQWFIVEQEAFRIPQLQSIKESLEYLKTIL